MKPCLIILFILVSQAVYGQREYLVEVNPETGGVNYHSILADVNYIATGTFAINANQNHYTFPGIDFNNIQRMYTADLVKGGVIYNPPFRTSNRPLWYNNGQLLSLTSSSLISINPETGTADTIATTYACSASKFSYTAYDAKNQQVYTSCVDGMESLIVKTNTGNNPGTYTSYTNKAKFDLGLAFHETSGKLFSLLSGNGFTQLIEQDLNGEYHVLSSIKCYYMSSTINQEQNKLIVIGSTDSASAHTSMKCFTLSLPDGHLIHTTALPPLEHQQDNLLNIAYNKGNSKYYMLHWDHDTTSSMLNNVTGPGQVALQSVIAIPNPFAKGLNLRLKTNVASDIGVNVYNAIGIKVSTSTHKVVPGSNSLSIIQQDNTLASGHYLIQVSGLNKPVSIKVLKGE